MAAGKKTGGRKKGTPNKTTKALREMILAALDQAGGQDYLATCALTNPAAFLALIGRVLPTTLAGGAVNVETITRIELVSVQPEPPKE